MLPSFLFLYYKSACRAPLNSRRQLILQTGLISSYISTASTVCTDLPLPAFAVVVQRVLRMTCDRKEG